jgi:triosephosphate isomerase
MQQLIAGNWKMNTLGAQAAELAREVARGAAGLSCDLMVCPPFTVLSLVAEALRGSRVGLGGQDCHPAPCGAHTGDIAAPMLADLGCTGVILGHSERRYGYHETSPTVRAKVEAAAAAGLLPIVCVGESGAERQAGAAVPIVRAQVAESLPNDFAGVLAYEPIWAIGTGVTATEDDIAAMHAQIRAALIDRLGQAGRGARILYGGSVKPDNAAAVLAVPDVGGALVGGASLDAAAFLAIAGAARRG